MYDRRQMQDDSKISHGLWPGEISMDGLKLNTKYG